MRTVQSVVAAGMALVMSMPSPVLAANHREAPVTALDHKADITGIYAFVSYGPNQRANQTPVKVTFIMSVDPLLEPANGATYFPFDDGIAYEIKIGNDHDGVENISFQFQFHTERRVPGVFTVFAGAGDGVAAPVAPGTLFDSAGLGQRQRFMVTMVQNSAGKRLQSADGREFYAVPAKAGPRTMDNEASYKQGTYTTAEGVRIFAGTTDGPFWIDLGATFDTRHLCTSDSGVPGVLTDEEDSAKRNFASGTVSEYAVNIIAVEVPIELLTSTGRREPATSPASTIGVWGTTSRPMTTVRRSRDALETTGNPRQVQGMATRCSTAAYRSGEPGGGPVK